MRSRVLSRPGRRRHARSTENTYIIATPEAVAGCPLPIEMLPTIMVVRNALLLPIEMLPQTVATDDGTPKRVLLPITTLTKLCPDQCY